MSDRAIIYARVSGDDRDQDGRNLQSQLDMGREYAQAHGYQVIAELPEDVRGVPGADFDAPMLNQALEMAQHGEFEVLIVRELDRFARRLAKQLLVEELFKRAGVRVEYVLGEYPDTPEGNFMKNVRACVAELERLKITERTTRGRRNKIKEGHVVPTGYPPYGYRFVRQDGWDTLTIHEEEARIVRLIFSWYTQGDETGQQLSLGAIAARLTKMGVPSPGDTKNRKRNKGRRGEWYRGTVHQLLKSETYAGTWHYGQRRHVDNKLIVNPESEQIALQVSAIVSQETYRIAQARFDENKRQFKVRKYHYLLSGRVKCGVCGLHMIGTGTVHRLYYRCPSSHENYRPCGNALYRVEQVDFSVWEWLTTWLADPAMLMQGLAEDQAAQQEGLAPLQDQLTTVKAAIADQQQRRKRLVDLYLSGEFEIADLKGHQLEIDQSLHALEQQHEALQAALSEAITQEQIQTLVEYSEAVFAGMDIAGVDFDGMRSIIEELDVQVVLLKQDGDKIIHASCTFGDSDVDQNLVLEGGQKANL